MRSAAGVLLITWALVGLQGTEARAQGAREGTARVLEDSSAATADTAVRGRSNFDVDVVRMQMPDGPGVWFVLYRIANGTLKRFAPFGAVQRASFAAASYVWTNDSTVIITLRDASGRSLAGFQITGYQSRGNIQRLP